MGTIVPIILRQRMRIEAECMHLQWRSFNGAEKCIDCLLLTKIDFIVNFVMSNVIEY